MKSKVRCKTKRQPYAHCIQVMQHSAALEQAQKVFFFTHTDTHTHGHMGTHTDTDTCLHTIPGYVTLRGLPWNQDSRASLTWPTRLMVP